MPAMGSAQVARTLCHVCFLPCFLLLARPLKEAQPWALVGYSAELTCMQAVECHAADCGQTTGGTGNDCLAVSAM